MERVTNTSKKPRIDWLFGANPNAIEAQEAAGQKELVESSQLPTKCNSPRNIDTQAQYEKMGIKVIGRTEGDEMFFEVVLPDGWKKVSTDHSMWSKLVDENGSERATFFYKAAFYDRDAFVNFSTRYNRDCIYEKESTTYCVKDSVTSSVIFEAGKLDKDCSKEGYFKKQDELNAQCAKFLNDNFPDHQDINAYWTK